MSHQEHFFTSRGHHASLATEMQMSSIFFCTAA